MHPRLSQLEGDRPRCFSSIWGMVCIMIHGRIHGMVANGNRDRCCCHREAWYDRGWLHLDQTLAIAGHR